MTIGMCHMTVSRHGQSLERHKEMMVMTVMMEKTERTEKTERMELTERTESVAVRLFSQM